jgi:hypothetical protein
MPDHHTVLVVVKVEGTRPPDLRPLRPPLLRYLNSLGFPPFLTFRDFLPHPHP